MNRTSMLLSIVYSRLRLRFHPTFINKSKSYIVAISFPYKLHTMPLHIQYIRTLSDNIHFILTSSITGRKKQALGKIFWPVSQRVQINFIFTDDVRIMCFYCNIKKSRRTAKLSEKAETNMTLMVSSTTSALYTVPFLAVALNESGTSKAW
jgi:hypothetical protein